VQAADGPQAEIVAPRTLVIGGAGFIGSHLVPCLLATGREVTVLGRRRAPASPLPPGAAYVAGDFGDRGMIGALLARHAEVVHLAYASLPKTSYEDPLADLQQNLPAAVQLFTGAAAAGCRLILVSSGGTVYGQARAPLIAEDHPTEPISPYGVTKLALERYAHLFAVTHGLKVVCLRPSNAYGAGQQAHLGQGFVATAMASAMAGLPVGVFGKHGTQRDYIYVSDVAAGIARAVERGTPGATYNLGTGVGSSNLDIVREMAPLMRELGKELRVEHLPERVFDVQMNVLDASKLRNDTGWAPKVTLGDGLVMTRDWLLRNAHGRAPR